MRELSVLPLPLWERLQSGGRRPEVNEIDFNKEGLSVSPREGNQDLSFS